jgi:UDPglucose 6-dehydrogenase
MNIGFLGLGKLGLPVALATEAKGHKVFGYDISLDVPLFIKRKKIPYKEIWANKYLKKSKIKFVEINQVVEKSNIIFVAIQTPHNPKYEGVTSLPSKRVDFDYSWLIKGVKSLAIEIRKQKKEKIVVIISTVLPGTIRSRIVPLLNKYVKLCYNPFFIAMGTTMRDFLYPEFILLGSDSKKCIKKVSKFYSTIHNAKVFSTSIENAELIKVSYNTFISTKISFINTLMEVCHKVPGTDIDEVSDALFLANKRIISTAYLRGGMGDGGGCHPRDNIALSWLAKKLDLSMDWFENIILQREKQTEWLIDIILNNKKKNDKIYILGKSFKPETNITTGSPSILLYNLIVKKLRSKYHSSIFFYDPISDKTKPNFKKGVYFIGTQHKIFKKFNFPKNSTVIDPFRYLKKKNNINLISLGKNPLV